MALTETITDYLSRRGLPYRLVPHPAGYPWLRPGAECEISPKCLVRAVPLRDRQGPLTAFLPSNHLLDPVHLGHLLERNLEPARDDWVHEDGAHCAPGRFPSLPEVLELPAIAEADLVTSSGELCFDSGFGDSLVCMTNENFRAMLTNADWIHFGQTLSSLLELQDHSGKSEDLVEESNHYTPTRLKGVVECIKELPPLPMTTHQIVELNVNQQARPRDLARIVERDASLAAQIIRWARSPYYSYKGRVDCVEHAITRVLGFDMVMNLTLGIALGRPFRIALDGPLGLRAFWRHSLYCATTIGKLVDALPRSSPVRPGMAYLAGLLHNFGFLLLGHQFPAQYDVLIRCLAVNSHLPGTLVERYVLGAEHPEIGAWLMQSWQMPKELLAAVRWHHSEDTHRPHSEYPNLVLIANRLLCRRGIGDENDDRLPPSVMSSLGLDRGDAERVMTKFDESSEELDDLSRQLSS